MCIVRVTSFVILLLSTNYPSSWPGWLLASESEPGFLHTNSLPSARSCMSVLNSAVNYYVKVFKLFVLTRIILYNEITHGTSTRLCGCFLFVFMVQI